MFCQSVGGDLPTFDRKAVLAVLVIAVAGAAFGAVVVLLLGQAAVL